MLTFLSLIFKAPIVTSHMTLPPGQPGQNCFSILLLGTIDINKEFNSIICQSNASATLRKYKLDVLANWLAGYQLVFPV